MDLGQFCQKSINFQFIEASVTEFGNIQFGDVHRFILAHHRFAICFYGMVQRFAITDGYLFGMVSKKKTERISSVNWRLYHKNVTNEDIYLMNA